jgi:hypothetical protein
MTDNSKSGSVFDRLDDLSDVEIAALTQAAIHVLQVGSNDDSVRDIEAMPTRPLLGTLEEELAARSVTDRDIANRIVGDKTLSRPIAIRLLTTIANDPAIAAEVETAYQKRQKLLTVGVDIILAAALLLLVLKVKRVRVGKTGVDVELWKLSDNAIKSVLTFVK